MTSNKPPRRGKVAEDKPRRKGESGPAGDTERDHEPLGDLSDTDLSDEEAGELARDIEAERDA